MSGSTHISTLGGVSMTKYHVIIESRATAAQAALRQTVVYEVEDYDTAWVGARTVCRLGTLFRDDPRCKIASLAREFFDMATGQPFHVQPGAWIVRRIFVDGTRKTGKQRMTSLTAEQLAAVLAAQEVAITPDVEAALRDLLGNEGLRITTAAARSLGIDTPNVKPPRRRGES